eukprot:CAMPEP_0184295710 /NCGR_PEP_ID=MMETSP1049-20130417/6591_1 /TAXON_ID=77928 /ORGANISM="Proteomonas sulcata, Strain CCMP704" /LENGTH=69 /DNA_ID=CAMNT_0026604427 /DNA_START=52 /DNA_END=261 /DNA_ORIENTATION=+
MVLRAFMALRSWAMAAHALSSPLAHSLTERALPFKGPSFQFSAPVSMSGWSFDSPRACMQEETAATDAT